MTNVLDWQGCRGLRLAEDEEITSRFSTIYKTAGALLALTLQGGANAEPATEIDMEYETTCRHYQNRTVFEVREGNPSFAATLADNCRAAMDAVGGDPVEETEALDYLDRLTELRMAVVALQVHSYRGIRASESQVKLKTRRIASISEAGEYLIARDLGVIKALNAWTERSKVIARAGSSPVKY